MQFPLGPYHPALPEPIALQLTLTDETVTAVDVRTGYLDRDIVALAPQRDLAGVLSLIEHVCATCSHSHRLALCIALEKAAQITLPERAQALRTLFAEIERIQARLWSLMLIGRVTEHGALATLATELRELFFEACVQATGRRLFWGVPLPGGTHSVVDPLAFDDALAVLNSRLLQLDHMVGKRGWLTHRATNIGIIPTETATQLKFSGILQRATGAAADLRRDAPYASYAQFHDLLAESAHPAEPRTGDVASRLRLMVADLHQSHQLLSKLLPTLPEGLERVPFPETLPPGQYSAAVEGPHGREEMSFHIGHTDTSAQPVALTTPGWLTQISLRTPSAWNGRAISKALQNASLRDVLLIFMSLDLCIACHDSVPIFDMAIKPMTLPTRHH